jgi:hypothetical protein
MLLTTAAAQRATSTLRATPTARCGATPRPATRCNFLAVRCNLRATRCRQPAGLPRAARVARGLIWGLAGCRNPTPGCGCSTRPSWCSSRRLRRPASRVSSRGRRRWATFPSGRRWRWTRCSTCLRTHSRVRGAAGTAGGGGTSWRRRCACCSVRRPPPRCTSCRRRQRCHCCSASWPTRCGRCARRRRLRSPWQRTMPPPSSPNE